MPLFQSYLGCGIFSRGSIASLNHPGLDIYAALSALITNCAGDRRSRKRPWIIYSGLDIYAALSALKIKKYAGLF